ncbi:hypothetical protein L6452_30868 [Arctium lappa]|uniref:Uncharacterized protein n=1 Tax=Arctium lappa TaxID=4217 RepID=A0ACB8ZJU3_ARCLA|nr:hypothetical protein L6452_30868 [Arctium lappa]
MQYLSPISSKPVFLDGFEELIPPNGVCGVYMGTGKACIYREEKNIIDLYVMLIRYSSLVLDTIRFHRNYQVLCPKERAYCKKVKMLHRSLVVSHTGICRVPDQRTDMTRMLQKKVWLGWLSPRAEKNGVVPSTNSSPRDKGFATGDSTPKGLVSNVGIMDQEKWSFFSFLIDEIKQKNNYDVVDHIEGYMKHMKST